MDVKSRNYLLRNRQALEKDIKTSYIMDRMISDEVLTLQDEEKVKQQVELSLAVFYLPSLFTCFIILFKNNTFCLSHCWIQQILKHMPSVQFLSHFIMLS